MKTPNKIAFIFLSLCFAAHTMTAGNRAIIKRLDVADSIFLVQDDCYEVINGEQDKETGNIVCYRIIRGIDMWEPDTKIVYNARESVSVFNRLKKEFNEQQNS